MTEQTTAAARASTPFLRAPRISRTARVRLTFVGLRREFTATWRLAADRRSFARFMADGLGYRAQRIWHLGGNRRRVMRFADGTELTYRVNRGDVRAIAEVWLSGAYELPFPLEVRTVIDMGANIGTAAVWFVRHLGAERVVAVEPVADNAELARANLARTDAEAEVIVAAVGPAPGTARFELSPDSTLGRLGGDGIEVPVVTPQALVDRLPRDEPIDLVKIDVEGAEQELFDVDLAWLERVRCVVIELHGDRVDWRSITSKLTDAGFTHYPIAAADLYRGPTDIMAAFLRQ
jgi:FkbM family methyltransferase